MPFAEKEDSEASEAYAGKHRPLFKAPSKNYPHGLKTLIEECWHEKPAKRPTFREIIKRLESILHHMGHKRQWRMRPLTCFQNFEHKKKHNWDLSSHDGSSSGSHLWFFKRLKKPFFCIHSFRFSLGFPKATEFDFVYLLYTEELKKVFVYTKTAFFLF